MNLKVNANRPILPDEPEIAKLDLSRKTKILKAGKNCEITPLSSSILANMSGFNKIMTHLTISIESGTPVRFHYSIGETI